MTQRTANFSSFESHPDAYLSSLGQQQIETLNEIYTFYFLKRWLHSTGWLNIFLGGFTIWMALSGYRFSYLDGGQLLMGLLILGQSVWAVVSPRVQALLRFAILFLLAGAWNTGLGLYSYSGSFLSLSVLLGLAQFWWAFTTYREYVRYENWNVSIPPSSAEREYRSIWKSVVKGDIKKAPNSIQLWIGRDEWRGTLFDNHVVFAHSRRKLLTIQQKEDTEFRPGRANYAARRRIYGRLWFRGELIRTMMKRQAMQRYLTWKGEAPAVEKESEYKSKLHLFMKRSMTVFVILLYSLIAYGIYFVLTY